MVSFKSVVLALAAATTGVDAVNHVVQVGANGLTFTPANTVARPGDTVEFAFYPRNHSVVTGTPAAGCTPGDRNTGFWSGFIPSANGAATQGFRVSINSTQPMYFYCSQGNHCQQGMYGAINGNMTALAAWGALNAAATTNVSPNTPRPYGGTVGPISGGNGTRPGNGTNPNQPVRAGASISSSSSGIVIGAVVGTLLLSL